VILSSKKEVPEIVHSLDVVIFDKTGTLTRGSPCITDIISFNGHSGEEMLKLATIAEKRSGHS